MLTKTSTAGRPAGHTEITWDDGRKVEGDTLQCAHCGQHWIVRPGSGRQRGWCLKCSGPLCGKQGCLERCYPMEKRLDDAEAGRNLADAIRFGLHAPVPILREQDRTPRIWVP